MPRVGAARFTSKRVEAASGHVELLTAGAGPPMVVVHASGMDPARYARLAGQWADRFTVIMPRLVGYGGTGPFDAKGYTLDREVEVIEAAARAANAPIHLVGHSFGGWMALRFAARHPERVATLSLYEPTVFGMLHEAADPDGLADLARFLEDPWFLDPEHGGTEPWMGAFVDYWNQAEFWAVMTPAQRAPLMALADKVFSEVRAVLTDRTPGAAWAGITRPTLIVRGSRTTPAAVSCARLLAGVITHAETATIDRAGHLAPLVRVGPIAARIAAHASP